METQRRAGLVLYPMKLLLLESGDMSFARLLRLLRLLRRRLCGHQLAPVNLCAGHPTFLDGAPTDWAVELLAEKSASHTWEDCSGPTPAAYRPFGAGIA